jgi:SpoVA protein.
MDYLWAFICGGLFCVVAELLICYTKLTAARILVAYVASGVLLTAIGLYKPLVDWAGEGAITPLTGFGFALAQGVKKAVAERGILGAFTGGLTATAGGIAAALVFAFAAALVFKGKPK